MAEFVASNGNTIRRTGAGLFVGGGSIKDGSQLLPSQVMALREFFLAERDAEMGRWRSKEHPEYVAYPHGDGRARVMHEQIGNSYSFDWEGAHRYYHPNDLEIAFQRVAREYFAAHPEPKPWHDAEPGEVWVLKLNTIDAEYAYVRTDGLKVTNENGDGWRNLTPSVVPSHLGLTAPAITAGRRIWPEA